MKLLVETRSKAAKNPFSKEPVKQQEVRGCDVLEDNSQQKNNRSEWDKTFAPTAFYSSFSHIRTASLVWTEDVAGAGTKKNKNVQSQLASLEMCPSPINLMSSGFLAASAILLLLSVIICGKTIQKR